MLFLALGLFSTLHLSLFLSLYPSLPSIFVYPFPVIVTVRDYTLDVVDSSHLSQLARRPRQRAPYPL